MKVRKNNVRNNVRNPVAKAMLQERKPPQTILPKKGGKQEYNRQHFKQQQREETKDD